jgi:hypothetical protein
VGRAPWPAVDPLVDLLEHAKSRPQGSGADGASAPPLVAAMLLCGAGGARLPSPMPPWSVAARTIAAPCGQDALARCICDATPRPPGYPRRLSALPRSAG